MTTAALHPETLVRDDGVRREIYRDPEVFALEMERIFKRTWVFMAHESELAASGDYLTMRIGAEPVVLVRGEDDEVRVLVNRCRHRGAIVCERAAGNAKSFRCQYHGWTYRNDGPLVGVPYPERHSADVRERLGLIALPRVESYRGLIFASFNPDVPPLADYLGPGAIGYIDRFLDQCLGLPLVAHQQAHRIAMEANWKLQLENGMDGYHAGFTHRSFFDVMQRRLGTSVRYASGLPTATSRAFRNGHCAIDPETTSRKPLISRVATLPEAAERLALLRERGRRRQVRGLPRRAHGGRDQRRHLPEPPAHRHPHPPHRPGLGGPDRRLGPPAPRRRRAASRSTGCGCATTSCSTGPPASASPMTSRCSSGSRPRSAARPTGGSGSSAASAPSRSSMRATPRWATSATRHRSGASTSSGRRS